MDENYFTRLKTLLKDKEISVSLLLESIDMSTTHYHSLVRYGNCPRADVAVKIAKLLDTSVEYMVTGQDTSDIPPDIMSQVRGLMALDKVRRTPILASVKSQIDFWKGETEVDIPTAQDEPADEDTKLLNNFHSLSERDQDVINMVILSMLLKKN